MLRVLRFWLIFAATLGNGNALAQDYPTGPVKIILSNSAGSSPDIVARIVADRLSKALGQQVFVENKPGGDSVLGAVLSARAAADGYTLYFAFNDALVSNRFRLKSLPYDPDNDFTPIANIVDSAPFVVAVHPDVPAKTFGELMEFARSNPGKLSYGTAVGLSDILAQWINKSAKVDILRVPYRVNGQAVQDALSGRVQILLISLPSIEQFARSGQLRMLAVSGAKRFYKLPDIPTIAETYSDLVIEGWFELVGPAGIPAEIVQRLNREVDKIVKDREFVERLAQFGFSTSDAMTPHLLRMRVRTDTERWRKIAQDIELKPQ
jgi:tripartite-type tricarboxylate transporter receptor subunit TctC